MKAMLEFTSRDQAKEFVKAWTRMTLEGHSISSVRKGTDFTKVTAYSVTEERKTWIDNWVKQSVDKSNWTPSEEVKAGGLKSLSQMIDLTGVPRQTLVDWHKNKHEQFVKQLSLCVAALDN